jgi:hypothetical protein
MKTYSVFRTPDGDVMAFVDGEPLYHVVAHSPDGFAFGRGPGADDLALSILADYFSERPTLERLFQGDCNCLQYHQDFKWAVVTPATDQARFEITSDEIEAWLEEQ